MKNLHNTPTELIVQSLASFEGKTAKATKRAADELAELNLRGVTHPLMKNGVLRYYRQIADGIMLPEFAYAFSANPIVDLARHLSPDVQRSLLKKPVLPAAVYDKDTKIIAVDVKVESITKRDLAMIIGEQGIRPFNEQKKILQLRKGPDVRRAKRNPSIKLDKAAGEIVIGDSRFAVHDFAAAFKVLGFKIEKIV